MSWAVFSKTFERAMQQRICFPARCSMKTETRMFFNSRFQSLTSPYITVKDKSRQCEHYTPKTAYIHTYNAAKGISSVYVYLLSDFSQQENSRNNSWSATSRFNVSFMQKSAFYDIISELFETRNLYRKLETMARYFLTTYMNTRLSNYLYFHFSSWTTPPTVLREQTRANVQIILTQWQIQTWILGPVA